MSKSAGLHNRIIAKNHEIVRKLRVSLEQCAVLEIFRKHGMLAGLPIISEELLFGSLFDLFLGK